MAQDDSGSNVAIIAIIIIAVLVAGAAFLYLGNSGPADPTVIERETVKEPTVIERNTTNTTVVPAPEAPKEGGEATIQHEDAEGNETEIHIEE